MDIQRDNLLEHFEFVFETAPICSPEMSDDTRILSHKQQGCLGPYCHQPSYVHHHGNTSNKNDFGHNEQSDCDYSSINRCYTVLRYKSTTAIDGTPYHLSWEVCKQSSSYSTKPISEVCCREQNCSSLYVFHF